MPAPAVRAGVIGSPVAHSLSPVLHRCAYSELGLEGWVYERLDAPAESFASTVAGLGPEWVGLSVTMPHKIAALRLARRSTGRARAVGAANTLVRTSDGWLADCTDVDGITGALGRMGVGRTELQGRRAAVAGAGGTARAALVALAGLGVAEVDLVVRSPGRAGGARECGRGVGLRVHVVTPDEVRASTVAVSTVPASASASVADVLGVFPAVLDVVYEPWPTPLATAATATGATVGGGHSVLLHQAFGQVELFTGRAAPRSAMAAALARALRHRAPQDRAPQEDAGRSGVGD